MRAFNFIRRKIKKSQLVNRVSELQSAFTVGLLAMRSSKLDPIYTCFDKQKNSKSNYVTVINQLYCCRKTTLYKSCLHYIFIHFIANLFLRYLLSNNS
jgi:hypothetical protein